MQIEITCIFQIGSKYVKDSEIAIVYFALKSLDKKFLRIGHFFQEKNSFGPLSEQLGNIKRNNAKNACSFQHKTNLDSL